MSKVFLHRVFDAKSWKFVGEIGFASMELAWKYFAGFNTAWFHVAQTSFKNLKCESCFRKGFPTSCFINDGIVTRILFISGFKFRN